MASTLAVRTWDTISRITATSDLTFAAATALVCGPKSAILVSSGDGPFEEHLLPLQYACAVVGLNLGLVLTWSAVLEGRGMRVGDGDLDSPGSTAGQRGYIVCLLRWLNNKQDSPLLFATTHRSRRESWVREKRGRVGLPRRRSRPIRGGWVCVRTKEDWSRSATTRKRLMRRDDENPPGRRDQKGGRSGCLAARHEILSPEISA